MGRASKDKRDIYYRKAKEEGYRARSAYKLLQIDEEFNIFEGVTRAVDLCAAPGSWSQVLSQRLILDKQQQQNDDENTTTGDAKIVAVDLQEMSPIHGVTILQGDITTVFTAEQIVKSLGNRKAQIVICDGAPDVTGLHDLDEYVQHQLLLAATNITTFVLEEGGTFCSKIFRGPHTPFLCEKLEQFFKAVTVVKPKSSRNTSMECFVLCSGFNLPKNFSPSMINPIKLSEDQVNFLPNPTTAAKVNEDSSSSVGSNNNNNLQKKIVPFLACGSFSGYDADMSYPVEIGSKPLAPVQPPKQTAPYHAALNQQKQQSQQSHQQEAPSRRQRGNSKNDDDNSAGEKQ